MTPAQIIPAQVVSAQVVPAQITPAQITPARKGTIAMALKALPRRGVVVAAGVMTAVGLVTVGAVGSPAADAANYRGAIAYSGSTGSGGGAVDYPTQAEANNAALSYCGYTDCKVLVEFPDCGAVAQNRTALHGGYGATLSAAMRDARSHLAGSWVIAWGCN